MPKSFNLVRNGNNLQQQQQQQHLDQHQQQQQQQQLHQQVYATIQRKQPAVPPFSHSKGFVDTSRLLGADAADVDHAIGASEAVSAAAAARRCNTLSRIRNLEMTEYQKQKLLNEADTVKIKVSN